MIRSLAEGWEEKTLRLAQWNLKFPGGRRLEESMIFYLFKISSITFCSQLSEQATSAGLTAPSRLLHADGAVPRSQLRAVASQEVSGAPVDPTHVSKPHLHQKIQLFTPAVSFTPQVSNTADSPVHVS
eukprot:96929-Hanusia_phi.AAC.3